MVNTRNMIPWHMYLVAKGVIVHKQLYIYLHEVYHIILSYHS